MQQVARLDGVHADGRHRRRPGDRATSSSCSTDPATGQPFVGTAEGLRSSTPDDVELADTGKITAAEGYTVLDIAPGQRPQRRHQRLQRADRRRARSGARACRGRSRERRSRPTTRSATASPTPTTGEIWTADDAVGYFVDEDGENLAQGWKVNVGFSNFTEVLTNDDHPSVRSCGSWSGTSPSRSSSVVHHVRARPAGRRGPQQRPAARASGSTARC